MTTQQHQWGVIGVQVGLVIMLCAGFMSTLSAGASSSTLTVELVPRPSDGVETVTLIYTGAGSLSLAGWTIEDTLANTVIRHTFGAVELADGDVYRYCTGNGSRSDCTHHTFFATVWNDGGDTLVLRDETGKEVLRISYTNAPVGEVYRAIVTLGSDGEPPAVEGCMDEQALNYNPQATMSDDSCLYDGDGDNGGGNNGGGGDSGGGTPPVVVSLIPLPTGLVPSIPGKCPVGFSKWVDEDIEDRTWYVDDIYEAIVVVGGPHQTAQNRDGARYLITDSVPTIGTALTRTHHDIGFVCVR